MAAGRLSALQVTTSIYESIGGSLCTFHVRNIAEVAILQRLSCIAKRSSSKNQAI